MQRALSRNFPIEKFSYWEVFLLRSCLWEFSKLPLRCIEQPNRKWSGGDRAYRDGIVSLDASIALSAAHSVIEELATVGGLTLYRIRSAFRESGAYNYICTLVALLIRSYWKCVRLSSTLCATNARLCEVKVCHSPPCSSSLPSRSSTA